MSGTGERPMITTAGQPQMNPGDQAPPGAPVTGENLCRPCEGTGMLDNGDPCPTCDGTGFVVEAVSAGP